MILFDAWSNYSWLIIIIIIFIIFIFIWLLTGGEKQQFIGLAGTPVTPWGSFGNKKLNNNPMTPARVNTPKILPKSPRIVPDKLLELSKEPVLPKKINIRPKYMPQNVVMTENLPTLPLGIIPEYEQDETLHPVMSVPEIYFENGQKLTRNKIIQKRYDKESKGEAICRAALEDIYGLEFKSVRPDFLKYHTNRNLEIDCWCDQLKIGLEYNGKQHYQYVSRFHKSEEDFIKQVQRDQWKLDKMDEMEYYLITVPYTVPHAMIRQYIEYFLPHNVQARQMQAN